MGLSIVCSDDSSGWREHFGHLRVRHFGGQSTGPSESLCVGQRAGAGGLCSSPVRPWQSRCWHEVQRIIRVILWAWEIWDRAHQVDLFGSHVGSGEKIRIRLWEGQARTWPDRVYRLRTRVASSKVIPLCRRDGNTLSLKSKSLNDHKGLGSKKESKDNGHVI